MIVLFIILAVFFVFYIIYSDSRYSKLIKENAKLRKQIKELKDSSSASKVFDNTVNNTVATESVKTTQNVPVNKAVVPKKVLTKEEKQKLVEERERKERETKNVAILITGAVLIVLAAVVFLLSTWNIIPDLIKTFIIAIVGGVFLGASKIAKDKFELPKASNTFFYIAMAYIPVCLLAIWVFGLLGFELSMFGAGSRLYLTLSSLSISVLYFSIYKFKKNNGMLYASVIAQIYTVVSFIRIFTTEISVILTGLLIYNLVLAIYNKFIAKENNGFITNVNYVLTYGLSIISVPIIIFSSQISMIYVLTNILSIVGFIILYLDKSREKINVIFANIFICVMCFTLISTLFVDVDEIVKVIIIVAYILISNIIQRFINNKDFEITSNIISTIAMAITYVFALGTTNGLVAGLVALVELGLLVLLYIKAEKLGKWILAVLIPLCSIISLVSIYGYFELEYPVYIISFLALNLIAEIFKDYRKDFHITSLIITHILTFASFVITSILEEDFINMPIYFMLLCAVYTITYIRNKEWFVFKYFSYIAGELTVFSFFNFLEVDDIVVKLAPMIATIIVGVLEMKLEIIKDKLSDAFIAIMQVISFMYLSVLDDEVSLVIAIMFAVLIYCYNIYTKKHFAFNIIPLISTFGIINGSLADEEFVVMMKMLIVCGLTGYTVYKKKLCIESAFSAIFLVSTFGMIEGAPRYLILMIWSMLNMVFVEEKSHKDICKVALYISGFLLYYEVIADLGILDEYMSFMFIGILVVYDLIMKNVLCKYSKDLEALDYFFYVVFTIYSIFQFISVVDALIFIVFIIASIMFSYILGWGSIFIMSIVSLALNIIYQSRVFWFNVPWYIYLLVAGGTLIGFAIINESNEKKNKLSIGKNLKKLKENIDSKNNIENVNQK